MFKFNFESNETNEIDEFEEETRTDRSDFGFLTFDEIQIDEENLKIKEKLELFQSDLVPSVYEGGLKTWECSHDLVDFVKTIIEQIPPGTSVLEVGCGSALPGLEMARPSRFNVDFQDFNREVFSETFSRLKSESFLKSSRFFYGDWADLIEILPKHHYDIILTSETIYNVRNYRKLAKLFDYSLKPNGVVFLAAKIYYFGVQGGVRKFEDFLEKETNFQSKVVRQIDANVKREILCLKRRTEFSRFFNF